MSDEGGAGYERFIAPLYRTGAALMELRALMVAEGVVVHEHAFARRALYVGVSYYDDRAIQRRSGRPTKRR